jgi:hypothetical protein
MKKKNDHHQQSCKTVVVVVLLLLLLFTQVNANEEMSGVNGIRRGSDRKSLNFAAADVGAKIVASNPEAKKVSRILNEDKDNYMLNPRTADRKWITVELSEEILMHSFALANFEYYSCSPRLFQVLGSREYPCRAPKCLWEVLGTFEAHNTRTVQTFAIQNPRSTTRYVKFIFLSHYGDSEYFCTLSLIRVHGSTLLEDLKLALSADSSTTTSMEEELPSQENTTVPVSTAATTPTTTTTTTETVNIIQTGAIGAGKTTTHLKEMMDSVLEITGLENEKMLEVPLLDPEVIRNILDNSLTKIKDQNRITRIRQHKSCISSDKCYSAISLYDADSSNMVVCNISHKQQLINQRVSDTSSDKPLVVTPVTIPAVEESTVNITEKEHQQNNSSNQEKVEMKLQVEQSPRQKTANYYIVNQSQSYLDISSNSSNVTSSIQKDQLTNMTATNSDNVIQPSHVEPERSRGKKIPIITEEEDEEQTIPRWKVREEASDNILKSLLRKIQKQEEARVSLIRNLQKVHTKYADAFRDIQTVLNKTAYEHNILAAAVYSIGNELKENLFKDVRFEFEKEFSKVRGEMELLNSIVHNLTVSTVLMRDDTMSIVDGYKKFMVVCMSIPLVFMLFVMCLYMPTTQVEYVGSRSQIKNTTDNLVYPLDERKGRPSNPLALLMNNDSDADDEFTSADEKTEESILWTPNPDNKTTFNFDNQQRQHKKYESPLKSEREIHHESPSSRKDIRLVDHIINYFADSDSGSRPTSPGRGIVTRSSNQSRSTQKQRSNSTMDTTRSNTSNKKTNKVDFDVIQHKPLEQQQSDELESKSQKSSKIVRRTLSMNEEMLKELDQKSSKNAKRRSLKLKKIKMRKNQPAN